jgi:hypothetical protein
MAANSLGNFGERVALDAAAGVSPSVTLYVHLYTDSVDAAGTGTEVSAVGTGYVKQAVTFSAAATVGGATTSANTNEVLFPLATASYTTVVSMAVKNAAGDVFWYGDLTAPKLVDVADQLRFAIGDIDLSMD